MFFEDGYKLNQEDTNDIILWAFLYFVKDEIKNVPNSDNVVFNASGLIESGLRALDISTFDFLNDESIIVVENALRNALEFLVNNKLIEVDTNSKDKFYKFFIKKEFFRTRAFSNDFEQDLILTLIYKLDFSFRYKASDEFLQFYNTYVANKEVVTAQKLVTVNLKREKGIAVLALLKHVSNTYLKKAIATYNYSEIADFIANYDKTKDTVLVFPTSDKFNDDALIDDLVLTINVSPKLKSEFKPY